MSIMGAAIVKKKQQEINDFLIGLTIHAHQLKRTNKMKFPSKGLQTVQQIDYS